MYYKRTLYPYRKQLLLSVLKKRKSNLESYMNKEHHYYYVAQHVLIIQPPI